MGNPVVIAPDAVLDGDFEAWTADGPIPQGALTLTEIDIPSYGKFSTAKYTPGNRKREVRRPGKIEIPETITFIGPQGGVEALLALYGQQKAATDSYVSGIGRRGADGARAPATSAFRYLWKIAVKDAGQVVEEIQLIQTYIGDVKPMKLKGSQTPEPRMFTFEMVCEDIKVVSYVNGGVSLNY